MSENNETNTPTPTTDEQYETPATTNTEDQLEPQEAETQPSTISASDQDPEQPKITVKTKHYYCDVAGDLTAKPEALANLIEAKQPATAVVFCSSRSDVNYVETILRKRGLNVRKFANELSSQAQKKVIEMLEAKNFNILVTADCGTSLCNYRSFAMAFNYSVPEQDSAYLKRTKNCAEAVTFVGPRDFHIFHTLKKMCASADIDFSAIELPSDDALLAAYITKLYAVVQSANIEIKSNDALAAKQVLREKGGIDLPRSELETFVAKLIKLAIEQPSREATKSLDEELDVEAGLGFEGEGESHNERSYDEGFRGPRRDDRRDDRRGGDRRGGRYDDRRHDHRDDRRGGGRFHDRQEQGHHDRFDRRDSRRDDRYSDRRERPQHREYGENRQYQGQQRQQEYGGERPTYQKRDEDQQRRPRRAPQGDIRLYIGQGTSQGMTEDLFRQLANTMGEIENGDIKRLTIRENYGFVDLAEPQASQLIANLNGIEYNGVVLPVERAATIEKRQQHQDRPNRDAE